MFKRSLTAIGTALRAVPVDVGHPLELHFLELQWMSDIHWNCARRSSSGCRTFKRLPKFGVLIAVRLRGTSKIRSKSGRCSSRVTASDECPDSFQKRQTSSQRMLVARSRFLAVSTARLTQGTLFALLGCILRLVVCVFLYLVQSYLFFSIYSTIEVETLNWLS